MKRKVIAITLTAMMAAGMLAGCGSSDSSSSSTADTTKEASATEADGSTDGDSTAAGGDFSGQISVISREDGSGTRGAFIELFGVEEKNDAGEKVDNTTVDAQITNNTSVMMSTVAGNQHAIGYISLGSLNDEVKALKIDGAEASAENVENGSYKVSRPFNIVTKDGLSADAQDFMDYILSTDGQQVVSDDGYIAIKDTKAYEGNCSGEKVVVAGSSSVTPLMEKLKEAYTKVNSNANIEVQQSDSTTGITSAAEGICDIGMASRELKDEETKENLTNDQKIKVIYQVKLNNKIMKDRTIKNTAKAKADNAKEVTAVREIKVRKQKIPENITYTKNKGNDFQNTDTSSGPKTGDESDLRWIFAMAAAAFSGILLLYRKKKH